ncbi:signal peptidase I [Corallococcus llansteffanensis]|uniref:Signal peptidase I n=1 Tax=Corallococcus llansteffanensis TaxID=2316731 RepID=A0A3A8Q602_9BACT|nr:signal peptidase I [Corallococcus llansteffanensis]RKH61615.1 signal peptidase I [Corallococcus llansteffanensis]
MSTASPSAKLGAAMAARRTPEQLKARRQLAWRELLTSLWAPLCGVGLAFVPYVTLIEMAPATVSWAQPLMKGFGLLMVAAFVGLLVWRNASRKESALRTLRHEARELLAEDERILERVKDKVPASVAERLTEQALRVESASVAGDVDTLRAEVKALETLTQEHLGAYRKQSAWDFVGGFAKALLIALVIRTVLVEPYRIPSGSMLPTLQIGDQVFVNKFIYGVRIPFMNVVPFRIVRAPLRGDVIVFNNPVDESKDFIKRVVGIPGDTVEIVEGVVRINGEPQARTLVTPDFVVHNWDERTGQWFDQEEVLYREDLSGVVHSSLQNPMRLPGREHEGPYTVPANSVFVMGDNRDNSADSRYNLGVPGNEVAYVPYGHIKGKAMVVWLSLGWGGLLGNLFGGTGLRVERFFEPVR